MSRLQPAALILQRLRQVPMIETKPRRNAARQQAIDQAIVEIEPARFDGAGARGHDARPRRREAISGKAAALRAIPRPRASGDSDRRRRRRCRRPSPSPACGKKYPRCSCRGRRHRPRPRSDSSRSRRPRRNPRETHCPRPWLGSTVRRAASRSGPRVSAAIYGATVSALCQRSISRSFRARNDPSGKSVMCLAAAFARRCAAAKSRSPSAARANIPRSAPRRSASH